ncbi:MAG TPA: chemotaxis protein CheD [Archaeoglobus profundus]|nr:chemotaxis protein CheD [Archaeoglobus profundus]
MQKIVVKVGEYRVVKGEEYVLISLGLGSCVCLAMYDAINKIGGLAHILLPNSNGREESAKYADQAVKLMVRDMKKLGAKNIVAKIVGGSEILPILDIKIGERNVKIVKEQLKMYNIKLIAEDVGGSVGRSVFFYIKDGRMLIKYSRGEIKWI